MKHLLSLTGTASCFLKKGTQPPQTCLLPGQASLMPWLRARLLPHLPRLTRTPLQPAAAASTRPAAAPGPATWPAQHPAASLLAACTCPARTHAHLRMHPPHHAPSHCTSLLRAAETPIFAAEGQYILPQQPHPSRAAAAAVAGHHRSSCGLQWRRSERRPTASRVLVCLPDQRVLKGRDVQSLGHTLCAQSHTLCAQSHT